jgi:hypothetical protein
MKRNSLSTKTLRLVTQKKIKCLLPNSALQNHLIKAIFYHELPLAFLYEICAYFKISILGVALCSQSTAVMYKYGIMYIFAEGDQSALKNQRMKAIFTMNCLWLLFMRSAPTAK